MDRVPVESSNITSVGYDGPRYLLEIEFSDGAVYQYARIPWHIYQALMDSPSKGSFFHRHIRDQYPTVKISDGVGRPGDRTPDAAP